MKITESIERECCQRQDLLPYHGARGYPRADQAGPYIYFCVHCGQAWEAEHEALPITGDPKKQMWRIII